MSSPRPASPWLAAQGVWGDQTRRHSSIEARGARVLKKGSDYQPSTAISRVPAYINFFAEVRVVTCMRGTAIGLVVPTVELDQQWSVSRMMKKEREVRQRELDKSLQMQMEDSSSRAQEESRAKLQGEDDGAGGKKVAQQVVGAQLEHGSRQPTPKGAAPVAQGGKQKAAIARSARDFEAKERQMALKQEARLVRQNLFAADHSIKTVESKVQDRWGPRLWYLTCDGLFGAGAECRETGAKFSDGDVVRVELENHRLMFSVNGKEVAETACEIQTRAFLAACLHMKGACVEIVASSLTEIEHFQSQETLEDQAAERTESPLESPLEVFVGAREGGDTRVDSAPNVSTSLSVSPPSPLAAAAAKAGHLTIDTKPQESPAQVLDTNSPTARHKVAGGSDEGAGREHFDDFSLLSPMGAAAIHSPLQHSLSFQASPLGRIDHDAFEQAFGKISDVIDGKWGVVERSFHTLDLENTGKVTQQQLGQFFNQFHLTIEAVGMDVGDIFSYIDEEEEGSIKYADFLEEVSVAGELKLEAGPVHWGQVHPDLSVNHDEQSVTASGSRGRSAFVSRIVSKGKHRFEFLIKKMTGTVFIGLVQATRKVFIERGRKVVEVKTRPMDDNWYYSRDTGGFSAWYISDIGVIRKDSSTLAQASLEIVSGDSVRLELNLDRSEVAFFVRGQLAGRIRGVEGELFPAVFIAGDEGDCVRLTRAEVVKTRSGASSLAMAVSKIVPCSKSVNALAGERYLGDAVDVQPPPPQAGEKAANL